MNQNPKRDEKKRCESRKEGIKRDAGFVRSVGNYRTLNDFEGEIRFYLSQLLLLELMRHELKELSLEQDVAAMACFVFQSVGGKAGTVRFGLAQFVAEILDIQAENAPRDCGVAVHEMESQRTPKTIVLTIKSPLKSPI